MLRNMQVSKGLVYSQHIMLELIKKGATRLEAYDLIQGAALECHSGDKDFKDLVMNDKGVRSYLSEKEISDCFSLDYHLRHVDRIFKNIGL
jgi:adenylosuccinate lyase